MVSQASLGDSGRRWFEELVYAVARGSRLGVETELKGPVGERNVYSLSARGAVLCDAPASEDSMIAQLACVLAAGGRAIFQGKPADFLRRCLPEAMRETIEIASPASRFDAVLTDVSLPGMSGIELARELYKHYPKLPVVISSGYGSNVQVMLGSPQPSVFVMPKPYDMSTLEKTLNQAAAFAAI